MTASENEFQIGPEATNRPSLGKEAYSDLYEGFFLRQIWARLGWQDIKQRYRRSIIGPFWLTLSTAILVATLGLLYSQILKQPLTFYLPYIGIGIIIWSFISSCVNEACAVFISSEAAIKQLRIPLSVHAYRLVWRNLIILAQVIMIYQR